MQQTPVVMDTYWLRIYTGYKFIVDQGSRKPLIYVYLPQIHPLDFHFFYSVHEIHCSLKPKVRSENTPYKSV